MEALCEQSAQSTQAELILDYIRTTAEVERQKPAGDATELAQQTAAYKAGAIIARSCLEIDADQESVGYRGLLRAKKVLAEHVEGIYADPRDTMVDAALDVAINGFGLPEAQKDKMTTLARDNLRVRTAESLNEYLFRFNSPQETPEIKSTIGDIVELTAIGILSRDAGVLSMPALPHHDAGKVYRSTGSNTNIDLTASWRPEEDTIRTRLIQTKAGCLLVGKHAVLPEYVPAAKRQSIISRQRNALTYEKNDILLISGCCDLNLSFGSKNLQTAEYLVKETFGKAEPNEIAHLDVITKRLRSLLESPGRIDTDVIDQLVELEQHDSRLKRFRSSVTTFLCNFGLSLESSAVGLTQSGKIPVADIYL